MKTLYFDCSSGISGNMTLGALLEIVGDDNYLLNELKYSNLENSDRFSLKKFSFLLIYLITLIWNLLF